MDSCKRRGGDRSADSAPNSAPSPDLVLSSSAGVAASIAAPPPPKLTEAGDDPLASTTVPTEMAASFSSVTTSDDDGSLKKRETWNRNIDFLLACIGFSVGLGNVWRFPYLCYKNGGGAFLIPYFICVIVGGIPMFFLEVALGQFMSEGGIGAWKICPLLQGIGFATTMIVFLLNVYYNVILAWALRYLFASFTSVLPWSHCDNEWNTPSCVVRRVPNGDGDAIGGVDGDGDGGMMSNVNGSGAGTGSFGAGVSEALTTAASGFMNVTLNKTTDPVTEYWERRVLRISAGIGEVGGLRWDLAACLLLAWVIIYFCIWKGIKSSGKVMYFTATSPYLLMFILLIRGLTLPGAMEGVKFYLIPDWARLMDHQVWVDAGTQIFFSYSISIGALTALGSYNKYHHNCWRHSVIFACTNSGTSLFAGFVIFSVLGFMAHEQGVGVGEVAESGPGLAFIAYPKAVAQMPVSPIWSILFFLMVILLGLDSQFVGVEGFVTAVVDIYARHLRKGYRRELFILVVCIVSFLIGLSMVTNGGMYVFQLFDYYSGSRIILLVAFFECVAISYIYGVRRFYDNIESMLGYRLNPYMQISWAVTTPIFTLMMFTLCIYSYSELTYNRTYTYPTWAISIGWSLASSSVIMIPAVAVYNMLTTSGSFTQRLQKLTRPRLRPHQLRPDDDPKDLIDYCQTYGSHNLDNVKVIGAKNTDQHPLTSPIDDNTTLPEPTEEDSLTKLPPDDYDTILQGAEEEEEGAEEYNDDVHVPINPPPASNVSPNKWGPKKG